LTVEGEEVENSAMVASSDGFLTAAAGSMEIVNVLSATNIGSYLPLDANNDQEPYRIAAPSFPGHQHVEGESKELDTPSFDSALQLSTNTAFSEEEGHGVMSTTVESLIHTGVWAEFGLTTFGSV
jgi:hypothetical protein